MTHSKKLRRCLAKLAVLAAVVPTAAAGLMVVAPAANADSSGCDNFHNVCIAVTGSAGNEVTITASPNSHAFVGTFTASGPNYSATSPDQYWGTGTGYKWTVSAATGGEYCVSGYSDDNSNEGMACEIVS